MLTRGIQCVTVGRPGGTMAAAGTAMDNTTSVSKGCFVFCKSPVKRKAKKASKKSVRAVSRDAWYESYRRLWGAVEDKLQSLHDARFSQVLHTLVDYVRRCDGPGEAYGEDPAVPAAAFVTGVNMPDHGDLYSCMVRAFREDITPHVAMLHSHKCRSLHTTIEQATVQLMNIGADENPSSEDEYEDDVTVKVKKSSCNFPVLISWYKSRYSCVAPPQGSPSKRRKTAGKEEAGGRKKLVIIIPDFENFNTKVVQDFVLVVSGYANILPLVFVFGIATTEAALHHSLPYHVSARLSIQVFQAPPSSRLLNEVLEEVLFHPVCPFHLGGKTFKFLMDVFLFFDFSVKGFIQGFKFCMMEHFCGQNWKSLCCQPEDLRANVMALSAPELERIQQLPSFRLFEEQVLDEEERSAVRSDQQQLKQAVHKQLKAIHRQLNVFHVSLACLWTLVKDLPKSPLGNQIRELYGAAVSTPIVKCTQFAECFQLLTFVSRDDLLAKLDAMTDVIDNTRRKVHSPVVLFKQKLEEHQGRIRDADMTIKSPRSSPRKIDLSGNMTRYQFKNKLLALSKQQKSLTAYEVHRNELLVYLLEEAFPQLLSPPVLMPLAELLVFDDVTSVRMHVVGSPRAAIHTALSDPHHYLECACCRLPYAGSLLPTMPDICIAYKLYNECGRYINLYDWLQAFVAVVDTDPSQLTDRRTVDPHLQARFMQAVSELQFMGFLKTSNRKVDHVVKMA